MRDRGPKGSEEAEKTAFTGRVELVDSVRDTIRLRWML